MHHPIDRMTHTTAFVTPVVEHWLEREICVCVGIDLFIVNYFVVVKFKITNYIQLHRCWKLPATGDTIIH